MTYQKKTAIFVGLIFLYALYSHKDVGYRDVSSSNAYKGLIGKKYEMVESMFANSEGSQPLSSGEVRKVYNLSSKKTWFSQSKPIPSGSVIKIKKVMECRKCWFAEELHFEVNVSVNESQKIEGVQIKDEDLLQTLIIFDPEKLELQVTNGS